jgi:ATPase subunit of ABC transporter with duplicated ATPase domains
VSLISLVGVRKDFGIRTLFDNLTLHVGDKERLGLIGPNGAGKSTLMRLLAGLEPPGAGERRVLPQARIVLVSQEPEMDPERTVLEQVFAESGEKMELLRRYKERVPAVTTKSGLMLGLGETKDEVMAVMRDMKAHNIDMVTLGQYLQPSRNHLAVARFVHPDEFEELRVFGEQLGFAHVASGPLVRSSYHADKQAKGELI